MEKDPYHPDHSTQNYEEKFLSHLEDLNTAIVGVSDHDLIVSLVDSHTTRTKLKQELAISIKHLNAMVVAISNNNLSP